MFSTRAIPALVGAITLAGCISGGPAPATPDAALVQAVDRALGGNQCSPAIASQLAGFRLNAASVGSIYQQPVLDANIQSFTQRQIWVKLAGRPGSVVIQYDKDSCRLINSYGADGASFS
jgi:glycerol uptake facilitator-like aquaporin